MKVITPVIKPKSVSMQIRNHLTPVSTPDLHQKKGTAAQPAFQESPKPPMFSMTTSSVSYESPRRRPASGGDYSSTGLMVPGRETIIGDDSPAIPHRGNFEWDSQGEESPAILRRGDGGGILEDPTKAGGLKSAILSNSPSNQSRGSPSRGSPSRSKSYAGITITGGAGNARNSPRQINNYPSPNISAYKAGLPVSNSTSNQILTLPANFQPSKLSEFASAGSNDEDDEAQPESSFALALKMSKKKLQKSPSHLSRQKSPAPGAEFRGRSSTLPANDAKPKKTNDAVDGGLETDESLSTLQRELKRASEERSKRISQHQKKVTDLPSTASQPEKKTSTLTKVLSERFDTMHLRMKSPDNYSDNSSDFDDSPAIVAKKPVTKTMSVPAGMNTGSKTPDKLRGLPPCVKPKPPKKKTDWSSSSVSQATSDDEDSKMSKDSATKQEEQSAASNCSMFDVKLRPTSKMSKEESPLVTAGATNATGHVGATKKLPPAVAPKKNPKKSISVDEQSPDDMAKAEQKDFLLPPPLTAAIENEDNTRRISYIDLEPPDAFNSDEATEVSLPPPQLPPQLPPSPPPPPPQVSEENCSTNSSALAPPPSMPPPLPTSAPPHKAESTPDVFVFESEEQPEDFPVAVSSPMSVPNSLTSPLLDSSSDIVLPSPIPSPPVQNRFSSSNLSTSPLPPPAFGGDEGSTPQQEGFWIDDPSSSLEALPTIPPFSPQSETSEPSEAPPPLPSEPPPDLDSDTSTEKRFSALSDTVQNGNEIGEVSSTGSSPLTYVVSTSEVKEGLKVTETPPGSVATVVPMATKEPTKGFMVRESEEVCRVSKSWHENPLLLMQTV